MAGDYRRSRVRLGGGHFGLQGMRERMIDLGGSLEIESA